MRLTKKEKNKLSCHSYRECDYLLGGTPRITALNKLGQLEDVEDELGIDLGILGKALLQGDVYVKEYCQYFKFYISGNHLYIQLQYGMQMALNLKDYGKTWALTKEE